MRDINFFGDGNLDSNGEMNSVRGHDDLLHYMHIRVPSSQQKHDNFYKKLISQRDQKPI
jgi:hypothetical protein